MIPAGLHAVVLGYGPSAQAADLCVRLIEEGVPAQHICVVHNPSRTGEQAVPPRDAAVSLLRAPGNLGYAGGMNLGIAHALDAGARGLLLLTHDARLAPGAVGALTAAAHADPAFGVLGPELFDPRRGVMFSYGVRVDRTGGVRHLLEPPSPAPVLAVDSIDGAVMLIRAEVFEQVGKFDERMFMYFEEAELNLRVRRAGWKIGVVRAARAEQQAGGSSRPGAYAYLFARNSLHFARQAAGVVGVAGGLARTARDVAMYGRRLIDPRRTPGMRAASRAALHGLARGTLDFALGRWGPPPPLPGMGDVRL